MPRTPSIVPFNKPNLHGCELACIAQAIYLAVRHVGNVVIDQLDAYLDMTRFLIHIGEADARCQRMTTAMKQFALSKALRNKEPHKALHERNTHAMATYAKFGFVMEGILRDAFWMERRRIGAVWMPLLREEFNQIRTV
ncbi:MAG: GNAT family protein [Verrucomicrobiota bacterium]